MFAAPGTYDVVLRLASEPGQIDDDREKRARGAALKVLDVPGEKLREGWTSQDFRFNTWPALPQGTVATYLEAIKQRDKHFQQPQRVRLGTALHHPSAKELLFDSTANISPVAHTYYSQAAFRYGEHIAKFALAPATPEQQELVENEVGRGDPPGVLRDWTSAYFAERTARFDSLAAHRPLGSINRVRREAYEVLGAWRHSTNATAEIEPTRLSDVPQ